MGAGRVPLKGRRLIVTAAPPIPCAALHAAPMLNTEEVRRLVEAGIPGAQAEVQDLTGTSDHFRILVSSPAFTGLSRIAQHKLVHRALGEHLTTTIHAVEIQIQTPKS